jgi:hypothetical protein
MYDCIGYNVTVMAQILALTETLHGVVNYNFALVTRTVSGIFALSIVKKHA